MSARRLLVLRTAVVEQGGEWTTGRVRQLYRSLNYNAPFRSTARRDLAQLARDGVLVLDDTTPTRRMYTVRPMPTAGELAEQRHLLDPLDHTLETLAPRSTQ